MKLKATSLLSLSVFALSGLIFTSSCKKSNGNSSGISASINGTAYQPATVQAIDSLGIVGIIGYKSSDTASLYVEFPDTVSLNKSLDITGIAYAEYSKGVSAYVSWNTYPASHGTLTVTSLDKTNKRVAGQFSGVLYSAFGTTDSVVIANGQFNSSFTAR